MGNSAGCKVVHAACDLPSPHPHLQNKAHYTHCAKGAFAKNPHGPHAEEPKFNAPWLISFDRHSANTMIYDESPSPSKLKKTKKRPMMRGPAASMLTSLKPTR